VGDYFFSQEKVTGDERLVAQQMQGEFQIGLTSS
jgi:hypothetical protein